MRTSDAQRCCHAVDGDVRPRVFGCLLERMTPPVRAQNVHRMTMHADEARIGERHAQLLDAVQVRRRLLDDAPLAQPRDVLEVRTDDEVLAGQPVQARVAVRAAARELADESPPPPQADDRAADVRRQVFAAQEPHQPERHGRVRIREPVEQLDELALRPVHPAVTEGRVAQHRPQEQRGAAARDADDEHRCALLQRLPHRDARGKRSYRGVRVLPGRMVTPARSARRRCAHPSRPRSRRRACPRRACAPAHATR